MIIIFHYTVQTNEPIEDVIQTLEEQLKSEQFGVLWQFNIKETLESKGFDFDRPFHVLEVCNPKEAKDILEQNLLVGYFLPCKIVVYEIDGKTMIGMPRPSELISMVEDESLLKTAKDIEETIIKCIDNSIR